MKKMHKFHKTTVEHHKDGSHTVEHHHEDGPEHNVKYAAGSHDHMMDGMMDHTSEPNPGEAEANAGPEAAAAPPAAPAAAGAMSAAQPAGA